MDVKCIGSEFLEEHCAELCSFLREATLLEYGGEEQRGRMIIELPQSKNKVMRLYESGFSEYVYQDGVRKTAYVKGEFRYLNTTTSNNPFSGAIYVYYQNTVCFSMLYYGSMSTGLNEHGAELVRSCWEEALRNPPPKLPIRGPERHERCGMVYTKEMMGSIKAFSVSERIYHENNPDNVLCGVDFMGGLVNQYTDAIEKAPGVGAKPETVAGAEIGSGDNSD